MIAYRIICLKTGEQKFFASAKDARAECCAPIEREQNGKFTFMGKYKVDPKKTAVIKRLSRQSNSINRRVSMKTKSPKVYTLAQVYKLLRKGRTTVYKYVDAGLITVSPAKVAVKPGTRPVFVVSESEYERLKRNGVDPAGMMAKTAKRKASGKAAKKRTAAAPGPAKKKSAYARGVTKKQVRRNAAAATRTATKKQAKRSTARRTRSM